MAQARIAMIFGIDEYDSYPDLGGCVNDARRIARSLGSHAGEAPNFRTEVHVSTDERITRSLLREKANDLFRKEGLDSALFYFAGHGAIVSHGACLLTQDAEEFDPGIPMAELLALANGSTATDRIIILDCCHSGAIDGLSATGGIPLASGVSILAGARGSETADEEHGEGLFTQAVCAALEGGAADVRGRVTVSSVYAFVDEIFAAEDQRPLFKVNVAKLVVLRQAEAPVTDDDLRRLLGGLFPTEEHEHPLDPSYEPTQKPRNAKNEAIFARLQRLRGARLVQPDGTPHMYYAAMENRSCSLTPLGKFYWRMAKKKLL